jgi:hypothetical protein
LIQWSGKGVVEKGGGFLSRIGLAVPMGADGQLMQISAMRLLKMVTRIQRLLGCF